MENEQHKFILTTDFKSYLQNSSYYNDMLFVDTLRVFKGEDQYIDYLENLSDDLLELFIDKILEKIQYFKNDQNIVFLLVLDKDYEYGS